MTVVDRTELGVVGGGFDRCIEGRGAGRFCEACAMLGRAAMLV